MKKVSREGKKNRKAIRDGKKSDVTFLMKGRRMKGRDSIMPGEKQSGGK